MILRLQALPFGKHSVCRIKSLKAFHHRPTSPHLDLVAESLQSFAPLPCRRGSVAITIFNTLSCLVERNLCVLEVTMSWSCPKCTFLNEALSDICTVCTYNHDSSVGGSGCDWGCQSCTFLNPVSESVCIMCGTTMSDATKFESSDLQPKLTEGFRSLKACQRSKDGQSKASDCSTGDSKSQTPIPTSPTKVSRKRKVAEEVDVPANVDETETQSRLIADADHGFNSLLAQLHRERIARKSSKTASDLVVVGNDQKPSQASKSNSEGKEKTEVSSVSERIVFLTYNVWFNEELELQRRMTAIGNIIELHGPHIICFQEVTSTIYEIFQKSTWWGLYKCSVSPSLASKRAYFCLQLIKFPGEFKRNPFRNTIMGRELCLAEMQIDNGKQLVVATTHLESPCPAPPLWNQMYSKERVVQANEAISLIENFPNVIFGGDMNWDDKLDGLPPLPEGWFDAWLKVHPEKAGLTYDNKANPMLAGGRTLQKRLDRIFCNLQDFEVESIEMVGTQPIPRVTYQKERKVRKEVKTFSLPVLPSDHFGLLMKIRTA